MQLPLLLLLFLVCIRFLFREFLIDFLALSLVEIISIDCRLVLHLATNELSKQVELVIGLLDFLTDLSNVGLHCI